MDKYTVRFTGFGAADSAVDIAKSMGLEVMKKGDVWNKRTGKQFDENVFSLTETVSYAEGFDVGIMRLVKIINGSAQLLSIYKACAYIELQIWISPSASRSIPSIHLRNEQLRWLSEIRADVDVAIY